MRRAVTKLNNRLQIAIESYTASVAHYSTANKDPGDKSNERFGFDH